MIRRPPRSTLSSSSAASDVYKRQEQLGLPHHLECVVDGHGPGLGGVPVSPPTRVEGPAHFEARPILPLRSVQTGPAEEPTRGALLQGEVPGTPQLPLAPPLDHGQPGVVATEPAGKPEGVAYLRCHHPGEVVEVRLLERPEDQSLGHELSL